MLEKILYHHRTQGEGAEGSHIRGMADGFHQLGYQVDIIGPPGVDPYKNNVSHCDDAVRGRSILAFFAEKAPQVIFELIEVCYNVIAFIRLYRQYRKMQTYSFLYERYALNSLSGAFLSSFSGIPFILEVNDATLIERTRPLTLKKLAAWHEAYIFSKATLIVTITNHFKNLIINEYDIDSDKILVLPNAIDPERFNLVNKKRFRRSKFSIPEDAVILGCAGNFVHWHGLDFLIEALAPIAKKENLFFLFIGDGPVKSDVLLLAGQLGISDKVHFTGFVSHDLIPKYLDLTNICIMPDSNYHGSPMKIFEYMAMSKPVVLPKYPPLLETITDGRQGLFFEPHDSMGLKTAVLKIAHSSSLCEKLGSSAFAMAKEKYTWKNNCKKLLTIMSSKSGSVFA